MEIKIDTVGKVVAGKDVGVYIKVVNDRESTGGFLILTAAAPDMLNGFDDWVEDKEMLQLFFAEMEWIVEWF